MFKKPFFENTHSVKTSRTTLASDKLHLRSVCRNQLADALKETFSVMQKIHPSVN